MANDPKLGTFADSISALADLASTPSYRIPENVIGAAVLAANRLANALSLRLIAKGIVLSEAREKLRQIAAELGCEPSEPPGNGSHPVAAMIARAGLIKEEEAERSSGGGEATRRVEAELPDGGTTEEPGNRPKSALGGRFYITGGPLDGIHYTKVLTCAGCEYRLKASQAARRGWPTEDLCEVCAKETEPDPVPEVADEGFRRIERGFAVAARPAVEVAADP